MEQGGVSGRAASGCRHLAFRSWLLGGGTPPFSAGRARREKNQGSPRFFVFRPTRASLRPLLALDPVPVRDRGDDRELLRERPSKRLADGSGAIQISDNPWPIARGF